MGVQNFFVLAFLSLAAICYQFIEINMQADGQIEEITILNFLRAFTKSLFYLAIFIINGEINTDWAVLCYLSSELVCLLYRFPVAPRHFINFHNKTIASFRFIGRPLAKQKLLVYFKRMPTFLLYGGQREFSIIWSSHCQRGFLAAKLQGYSHFLVGL